MKMKFFFLVAVFSVFSAAGFTAVSVFSAPEKTLQKIPETTMEDPLLAILQEVGIAPVETISETQEIPEKQAPKTNKEVREEKRKLVLAKKESEKKLQESSIVKKSAPVALVKREEEQGCTVPAEIPEEIETAFFEATKGIPCELLQTLRSVEIFEDPKKEFPRGLANGKKLKIRSDMISSPDLVNVIKHELGHVVDLGGISSQEFATPSAFSDGSQVIFSDDASVEFYQISWNSAEEKKSDATSVDFVGGYASGDMFEDFAEAFLAYQIQGNAFRFWATQNEALAQKYAFLKEKVFAGKEFDTGYQTVSAEERPWDMTKF